jgi:error-prone DNA polymerase
LTHDPGMYPKRLILDEARQWGIIIAPIDINRSDRTYRVERTDLMGRTPYQAPDLKSTGDPLCLPDARGYAIRIAFSDIKGISEGEIDTIISGQPYLDLADFSYRSGASKPITENLVTVGAFDQLHGINTSGVNRRDLLLHLSDLHRLSGSKNLTTQNQLTFNLQPSDLIANGFSDFTANEEVAQEMAILGMDTSQHLIHSYGTFLNEIKAVRSNDLIRQRAGTSVLVAGIKVALQTPPVRSGRRVIFLTLDDGYGCNDITFFEDAQQSYAELLYRSKLFLIEGEIRRTGPRGISLRATKAWDLTVAYQKWNTDSLTSITSG